MNRFILIIFAALLLLTGCSDTSQFEIGYTTPGIPISITVNSSGSVGLNIGTRWVTPIGTFSIEKKIPNKYLSTHTTKIIIKETTKNKKYFYELLAGESFNYSDSYQTFINIEEKYNSTMVTIESDEINRFLKVARVKDPKPKFPESPLPYFWLTKKINVDWTVNSIGDFVLDVVYCFIYSFTLSFDLGLIMILFILRSAWFIILGLIYIFNSIF